MEIDDELKNRIAGVIVVTILAVIFLPMFFEDSEVERVQEVTELTIPQKHEVSPSLSATILPSNENEVLIPAPETPSIGEQYAATDTNDDNALIAEPTSVAPPVMPPPKVNSTPEPVVTTQPEQPQVITQAAPATTAPPPLPRLQIPAPTVQQKQRLFIQVASFSTEKNALALRDKIRLQKYSAFVDSTWTKKGRVYRVKVGPELDRKRAEIMRNHINQLNHVKSIIVTE